MRTWTVKIDGVEAFSHQSLHQIAGWINQNRNKKARVTISSFPEVNA